MQHNMWSLMSRIATPYVWKATPVGMALVMATVVGNHDYTSSPPGSISPTTTTTFWGKRLTVQCEEASTPSRRYTTRLRRKHTQLQHAMGDNTSSTPSNTDNNTNNKNTRSSWSSFFLRRSKTQREIEQLQIHEEEMLLRWERDEDGWRELPARAWPAYQPTPEQMKEIESRIQQNHCSLILSGSSSSSKTNSTTTPDMCTELLFQMATTLVFYNLDPQRGLEQFETLAKNGHVDSMVACGVILVEGMGVPPKEEEGIQWLQRAVDLQSTQGYYELGTLFYTGVDGVLEENPKEAFRLFELAAQQDHTAGLYMMADCLLEGEGTERNVGRAIPLFYRAAERGHRFARQRIRELLATYSSRPM